MQKISSFIRVRAVILLAFVSIGFAGCKKNDETQPGASKEYYFSATIDGKEVVVQADRYGYDGVGAGASYDEYGQFEGNDGKQYTMMTQTALIMPVTSSGKNTVGVTFIGSMVELGSVQREAWETAMMQFFKTGTYPFVNIAKYRNEKTLSIVRGWAIDYYDENGVLWSTVQGSADQTGSSFKLLSVENNTSPYSKQTIRQLLTAEFSCKLYNDKGEVKTVTNGKFKSIALYNEYFMF